MKQSALVVLLFLGLGLSFQAKAIATDSGATKPNGDINGKANAQVRAESRFGYETAAAPERTIKIEPGKTKSIRVNRLETVRITDGTVDKVWVFDTFGLAPFALTQVAPHWAGITVYVDENPFYMH